MRKDPAKQRALDNGDKRYIGTICSKCGGALRNTCDGACVECNKARARARQADKRKDGSNKQVRQKYEQGKSGKATRKRYNSGAGKHTNRKYQIKSKFGITLEQYDQMLEQQNGTCHLCNNEDINGRRLAVDHCHNSGIIRGLLCTPCNTTLGLLKDDVNVLRKAIDYLEKPSS